MKIQVYPNGLYYFPVKDNNDRWNPTEEVKALRKATGSASIFYKEDFETVKEKIESNGHSLEIVDCPK